MTSLLVEDAFGRGKVILLGEHAVVYGRPALAAGMDRGVRARAVPADEMSLSIPDWDREVSSADGDDLGRAFATVLAEHPRARPVRIQAIVGLPAGAGLGCSAALGVAVVRVLAAAGGETLGNDEVVRRALAWERIFHGNPSGIDTTMAAHGGVGGYRRGEALRRLRLPVPLRLVVGNSGKPTSTRDMVDRVARLHAREPGRFDAVFDEIGALAAEGATAVEAGDLRRLGRLMDENQAHLDTLHLSTPALEHMCATARQAGALGAKLTGAGGGGCMIALAPDAAVAEEIKHAIERTGHAAFIAEVR